MYAVEKMRRKLCGSGFQKIEAFVFLKFRGEFHTDGIVFVFVDDNVAMYLDANDIGPALADELMEGEKVLITKHMDDYQYSFESVEVTESERDRDINIGVELGRYARLMDGYFLDPTVDGVGMSVALLDDSPFDKWTIPMNHIRDDVSHVPCLIYEARIAVGIPSSYTDELKSGTICSLYFGVQNLIRISHNVPPKVHRKFRMTTAVKIGKQRVSRNREEYALFVSRKLVIIRGKSRLLLPYDGLVPMEDPVGWQFIVRVGYSCVNYANNAIHILIDVNRFFLPVLTTPDSPPFIGDVIRAQIIWVCGNIYHLAYANDVLVYNPGARNPVFEDYVEIEAVDRHVPYNYTCLELLNNPKDAFIQGRALTVCDSKNRIYLYDPEHRHALIQEQELSLTPYIWYAYTAAYDEDCNVYNAIHLKPAEGEGTEFKLTRHTTHPHVFIVDSVTQNNNFFYDNDFFGVIGIPQDFACFNIPKDAPTMAIHFVGAEHKYSHVLWAQFDEKKPTEAF